MNRSVNKTWCSHHKRQRHPSELSEQNRTRVLWCRRTRAWLITQLGGKCVDCGATEELEFDELVPRPADMPAPNRTSRWQRLRNYLKIWKAHGTKGLALRCRVDNARRGAPIAASENDPF